MKKIEWYHALIAFLFFLILSQIILGPILIGVGLFATGHQFSDIMAFSTSRTGVGLSSLAMFLSFVIIPFIYMAMLKKPVSELFDFIPINVKHLGFAILGMFAFGFILDGINSFILDSFPNYDKSILVLIDDKFSSPFGDKTFHEMVFDLFNTDSVFIFIMLIIIVGVLPGIGEEFLFRGFMQRILMNKFSFFWAVILSGGLFGAMHLFQDMSQGVGAFLISFYLGFIYLATKNLWVPIICHMVNNSFTGTIAYLYPEILLEKSEPSFLPILIALPFAFFVLKYLLELNSNREQKKELENQS